MRHRSKLILTILAIVLLGVFKASDLIAWADPPVTPINKAPSALMRSKMTSSQSVLEGLLRKDFKAVERGAREMKRISEAAEWPRARDTVYEHFSAEFRRQCNQLESLARKGNHEGATFTYLQMTTICIHCHDYVRDSLRVADGSRHGNVQLIPSQWPQRDLKSDR